MEVERVVVAPAPMRAYMLEQGIISKDDPVVENPKEGDVMGKHVIGEVSLPLAALAHKVTVVPLHLPKVLEGKDLGYKGIARYAGNPRTYIARETLGED